MTDDNKNKEVKTEPAAEAEREEKAENAETPAAETAEEQNGKDAKKKQRRAEAELLALKKKVEEQTAALAAAEDKYLRLAAEYDNFRKRTAKERENLFADVYADALAVFLPVIDNLERAAQYSDGESVTKGVAMTLKSVSASLEKLGVTEIEALGKPFDPALHNAVLHVEDESVGENVVVEVLQKGYRKGDRVLRYAMVKVAN